MSWKKITVVTCTVSAIVGATLGLGVYTFHYGEGLSYFSDNPASCANCHIMQNHYDAWHKSSHSAFATCNDCHLSRHPIGKYITKADNGFFHSWAFTLQNFHEPIQIKPRNVTVAENNCRHCHSGLVHELLTATNDEDELSCVRCHTEVGHSVTR